MSGHTMPAWLLSLYRITASHRTIRDRTPLYGVVIFPLLCPQWSSAVNGRQPSGLCAKAHGHAVDDASGRLRRGELVGRLVRLVPPRRVGLHALHSRTAAQWSDFSAWHG